MGNFKYKSVHLKEGDPNGPAMVVRVWEEGGPDVFVRGLLFADADQVAAALNFVEGYGPVEFEDMGSLTLICDNTDGVEDERNLYLAYFFAMDIDVAEVTRIGRQQLQEDAYPDEHDGTGLPYGYR